MKRNKNPWLGWASYDEKSLSQGYHFKGRSSEISELFSLIENNLLVTIYGKSGIGKTSILNAGVFPSLKAAGYLPIVCRCGTSYDYPTIIIKQITDKYPFLNIKDGESFLNISDFFREIASLNKPVYPVLVFDQFEDWFRINAEIIKKLLIEISFLISDEHKGLTNFRFVISIREDYLYLLEDIIDNLNFSELKGNRYRLTNMSKSQVEEIFDLGFIEQPVRNRILEIAKESVDYAPSLVSFFCHELYELYPNGIKEDALKLLDNETTLIEKYYDRCFNTNKISEVTRLYIEDNLQDNGLRRPQNINIVQQNIKKEELNELLGGSNRLFQKFPVGSDEYIELLHDKIAEVLYTRKRKRDIERKKKKRYGIYLAIFTLVLVSITIAGLFYSKNKVIQKNINGMYEMQSRVVSKIAQENKSPVKTIAMLLDVLPKDYNNPDRPYTQEAGTALLNLLDTTRLEKVIPFEEEIFAVDISRDESKVLVAFLKNIIVYDSQTWEILANIPCNEGYITYACFGTTASKVIFATPSSINIWNIDSGTMTLHIDRKMYESEYEYKDHVTVSADRTKILVRDYDSWYYRLYSTQTGKLICKIKIPGLGFYSDEVPTFNADGSKLIYRIIDNRKEHIIIFDSETGKVLLKDSFIDNFAGYGFCPRGEKFFVINNHNSGRLIIKDVSTGETLLAIDTPKQIQSVNFNPLGTQVVVAPLYENKIIVYDACSGEELQTLIHPYFQDTYDETWKHGYIKKAYFCGRIIVTATNDRVCLWDMYYNNDILKFHCDRSIEGEECFERYSKFLNIYEKVISASSHELLIWNMSHGYNNHSNGNYIMNSDSSRIIDNWHYNIYDALTRTKIAELKHNHRIWTAEFSQDGVKIVTSSADSTAKIWDASTGKQLLNLVGHTGQVDYASFCCDDKKIFTKSADSTCRLWDVNYGEILLAFNPFQVAETHNGCRIMISSWWTARISSDGTKIGVINPEFGTKKNFYGEEEKYNIDRLYVFNAETGDFLWSTNTDGEDQGSIIISSNGRTILVGKADKRYLYDFNTGELLQEYQNLEGEGELIFSDDGSEFIIYDYLVAAYRYKTLTGELLLKFDLSTHRAFQYPDTKYDDGYVKDLKSSLWELTDIQSMINRGNEILNGYKLTEEDKHNYYLE